jgi:hypothetical protein
LANLDAGRTLGTVEHHDGEPTEDDLIRFARDLLGRTDRPPDEELVRDSVRYARDLWVRLYEANQDPPAPQRSE